MSLGTLPPVAHGEFVTLPVEVTKGIPSSFTNGSGIISEWTVSVQAVTWDGETDGTPFQAVVDTGNWLNSLPEHLATKINAKFDPPAGDFDTVLGYYPVACNATPPANFGIQFAGQMFSVNSKDMIWRDFSGKCYSSVTATIPVFDIALYFIGDAFLKNVVAVFDFGKDEIRFAPRIESNSSSTVPATTGAASGLGVHVLALAISCIVATVVGL